MNLKKKILPDALAILAFVIISLLYFFTPTINNQVLLEHDTAAGMGAGQEAKVYYEEHGERTRWTNSLFSGMPTYQISPSYDSTDTLRTVEKVYSLFLPKYAALVFIMLVGFYLLMRSFKLSPLISALGAFIWAFSSYFFILIVAGHLWKFITLAYIPPTIAGINWAYQKKYLLGGIVAALFASLQLLSNHVQMTYYFLFVILFLVIAYFIQAYKSKEIPSFLKSTGVLLIAGVIAITINSSHLYHTYQYSKESNRGISELSVNSEQESQDQKKQYITQWSYGIDETLTLLIPNYKGGASQPLNKNKGISNKINSQYGQVYSYFTQYFGTQPSTVGPVYVGAFVLFLFFIGCFFVKGPIKWALVSATLFSILLSWGKNFMPLTDFFIDYVPLYDKFRAVSSILVIAEFTIPILAILGLVELLNKVLIKDRLNKNDIKYLSTSFLLTAGISFIIVLFPTLSGPFISPSDGYIFNQLPKEIAPTILQELTSLREMIVRYDAIRSLAIILVGVAALLLFFKRKINKTLTIVTIIIIVFFDLWTVNKRYINDSYFSNKQTTQKLFKQSEVDKYILKDKDPNYRVLNISPNNNTFNENNTSYWHKSIGGYNAVKIGRYQELIEKGIYADISLLYRDLQNKSLNLDQLTILNMLNTKYIILGDKPEQVLLNESRYGNAWFVKNIVLVDNADKELQNLLQILPNETAILNKSKSKITANYQTTFDNVGSIELTSYEPNKICYRTTSDKNGFGVFSEIYYPEWSAKIDGKEVDIYQVDYVLRGINIPSGNHEVVFEFKPKSITITESIAYISLLILALSLFVGLFKAFYRKK